jgi:hypothetical protein
MSLRRGVRMFSKLDTRTFDAKKAASFVKAVDLQNEIYKFYDWADQINKVSNELQAIMLKDTAFENFFRKGNLPPTLSRESNVGYHQHRAKMAELKKEYSDLNDERPTGLDDRYYIMVTESTIPNEPWNFSILYLLNNNNQLSMEEVELDPTDQTLLMEKILAFSGSTIAEAKEEGILDSGFDAIPPFSERVNVQACGFEEYASVLAEKYAPKWTLDPAKQSEWLPAVEAAIATEFKGDTTLLLLGERDRQNPSLFRLTADFIPDSEGITTIEFYETSAHKTNGQLLVADYNTVQQLAATSEPSETLNITNIVIRCHGRTTDPLPSSDEIMLLLKKFPHVERVVFRTCSGINADEAEKIKKQAQSTPGALHRFKGERAPAVYYAPLLSLTNTDQKQAFLQQHPELREGDTLICVTEKNTNLAIINFCRVTKTDTTFTLSRLEQQRKQIKKDFPREVVNKMYQSSKEKLPALKSLTEQESTLILPPALLPKPEAPKHKWKGTMRESTEYIGKVGVWSAPREGIEPARIETLARELDAKLAQEPHQRTLSIKAYVGPYTATTQGVTVKDSTTSEFVHLPKALEFEVGTPKTQVARSTGK